MDTKPLGGQLDLSLVKSQADGAQASAAEAAIRDPANLAKIHDTAQQFEASFVSQMLSHMFQGVGEDPTFGGGEGEQVFRSFLVDSFGKIAAKAGGLGIADAVQKEMLRIQEAKAQKGKGPG